MCRSLAGKSDLRWGCSIILGQPPLMSLGKDGKHQYLVGSTSMLPAICGLSQVLPLFFGDTRAHGTEMDELNCFPPCYLGLLAFVLLIQHAPQRHCYISVLVRFVVGIKQFFIPVLPRSFQVRICDIPIGSRFSENRTQVLAEIFDCGSAKEPVAVVDLVNDETRFKHDRVWDHRIVQRIRVFSDIEVSLNYTPGV